MTPTINTYVHRAAGLVCTSFEPTNSMGVTLEIHQQILVARPTQRAIVLGKGGARIKAIGEAARTESASS